MKDKALVLDLDDTLYAELDFLKSAYQFIAKKLQPENHTVLYERLLELYSSGANVFDVLLNEYPQLNKTQLFDWYRFHEPTITLYNGVMEILQVVKNDYRLAIITDGRSKTQRNKIQALGLMNYIEKIVISEEIGSEKPNHANYLTVEQSLSCIEYIYVGDNLKKDFVTPNKLGWKTICLLDNGQNIHKQDLTIADEFQAQFYVKNWNEVMELLKCWNKS